MIQHIENYIPSAALLAGLIAIDYIGVLLAMLVDLRSGIVKVKRTGGKITSRGYRATVEKAGRYYLTLFAMTAIDIMIVAAIVFLRIFSGWNLPPFPLFTTVGAVALGVIELKSIMENTRSGDSLKEAAEIMKNMLNNPDIRRIAEEILNNAK